MTKELKVSQSSFSMFERCSMQYKWQFIDEIPLEEGGDNIYAIFGSTFHKCMELHERFNVAKENIVAGWNVLFLFFFSEAKKLLKKDYDLKDRFLAQGYIYLDHAFEMIERWKQFKIISSEKYVKLPFDNKFLKAFLSGKIDLILKDDEEVYVCLDWKTSKSKEEDIDANDQLTFYIYFIHILFPLIKLENIHGCLAYPHDKKIIFTQRTEKDFEQLFVRVTKMIERISICDFKKEPKLNFRQDDCFFCPYKKRCQTHDN